MLAFCGFGPSRRAVIVSAFLFLPACASLQLNSNALDLAGSVDDIITSQILHNVAKFVRNPSAIPTQVALPAGSVTTTNQAQLQFADPFSKALTLTQTLTQTIAASVTNTMTGTKQSVKNAKTLTPTVSDQWSQSWTLNPVTDADQMRRLRALYRYATKGNDSQLCREYTVIQTPKPSAKEVGDSPFDDPMFLKEPSCVLCSLSVNKIQVMGRRCPLFYDYNISSDIYINPKLNNSWLRYSCISGDVSFPPPNDDDERLGSYGGCTLYTSDVESYYQFVLFVLEALGQGSATGQSGKNPKGGMPGYVPYGAQPSITLP